MNKQHGDFLARALLGTSLIATIQRGKLYRKGSSDAARKDFRNALRRALEALVPQYKKSVSHRKHCANIKKLADKLSVSHNKVLNGGRFRIGSAQKVLNLYLKFLWCLGQIPRPPHCPFDAVVLSRIPASRTVKWTRLDNMLDYQQIVANARLEAEKASLADWELGLYESWARSGLK